MRENGEAAAGTVQQAMLRCICLSKTLQKEMEKAPEGETLGPHCYFGLPRSIIRDFGGSKKRKMAKYSFFTVHICAQVS